MAATMLRRARILSNVWTPRALFPKETSAAVFKHKFCDKLARTRFSSSWTSSDEGNCDTLLQDPIRQVFISQSHDAFTNLALEDWLYKHHDYDHKSLLLLWTKEPCVVIGRHPNTWMHPKTKGNNMAEEAVYHDLGHLNCTFFTRGTDFDHRRNLEVVGAALQSIFERDKLHVYVNDNDNIAIGQWHRDIQLVDTNECVLYDSHYTRNPGLESRSTQSVRIPLRNLLAVSPNVTMEEVQAALGWQFLKTDAFGSLVNQELLQNQRGFQMVRPDDVWYPGLDKIRQDFEEHHWIFGKSPKFRVKKSFPLPIALAKNVDKDKFQDGDFRIEIEITVAEGRIHTVEIQQLPDVGILEERETNDDLLKLSTALQGLEFGPKLPDELNDRVRASCALFRQFLAECIFQMVSRQI